MKDVLTSIQPYEFELLNGEKLKVFIESCSISPPRVSQQIDVRERRIFPAEARQRAVTYTGNCTMTLGWYKNERKQPSLDFEMGPVPIMIRVRVLHNFNEMFVKFR